MKYVSIQCKVDGNANDFLFKYVLNIQFQIIKKIHRLHLFLVYSFWAGH